ncbi:MAG: hypothetical protein ACFFBC_07445, partial [Promethearchaeota archaeon]
TKAQPKQVVDLINHIKEGKITTKIAKTFISEMMKGASISKIIERKGKKRISNEQTIEEHCKAVIKENPRIVEDCRKNQKAIEALIGRVMGKTKGQADPEITRKIIVNILKQKGAIE